MRFYAEIGEGEYVTYSSDGPFLTTSLVDACGYSSPRQAIRDATSIKTLKNLPGEVSAVMEADGVVYRLKRVRTLVP